MGVNQEEEEMLEREERNIEPDSSPKLPRLAMPERLVLIRHGESQANLLHRALRKGVISEYPPGFAEIPDREIRLSSVGVEQAQRTGTWLAAEYPDRFDVIFVSDHVRARETAGIVLQAAGWHDVPIFVDPLVGERSWGRFSQSHGELQQKIRGEMKRDPLHAAMPDGESLLHTRQRTRAILERVSREYTDKRVLIFTHGEYIEALWAEVEHMDTERQRSFFHSTAGDIRNCQVVEFSSVDPVDSSSDGRLRWVRSSCPQAEHQGSWQPLVRITFTPAELLDVVSHYPTLEFPDCGEHGAQGPTTI